MTPKCTHKPLPHLIASREIFESNDALSNGKFMQVEMNQSQFYVRFCFPLVTVSNIYDRHLVLFYDTFLQFYSNFPGK
jgi:hypothetical protein